MCSRNSDFRNARVDNLLHNADAACMLLQHCNRGLCTVGMWKVVQSSFVWECIHACETTCYRTCSFTCTCLHLHTKAPKLYAVKVQTSLAPLSWFPGSRVPTAHVHQCCRFFRVMRRLCHCEWNWQWNWQSMNHIPGIYDNGPRDHGMWRLTLTAYRGICTVGKWKVQSSLVWECMHACKTTCYRTCSFTCTCLHSHTNELCTFHLLRYTVVQYGAPYGSEILAWKLNPESRLIRC